MGFGAVGMDLGVWGLGFSLLLVQAFGDVGFPDTLNPKP